jgi:hypothetical protein
MRAANPTAGEHAIQNGRTSRSIPPPKCGSARDWKTKAINRDIPIGVSCGGHEPHSERPAHHLDDYRLFVEAGEKKTKRKKKEVHKFVPCPLFQELSEPLKNE